MIALKFFSRFLLTAIVVLICLQFVEGQESYWLALSALLIVPVQIENSFLKVQFFLIGWGLVIACHVGVATYVSVSLSMIAIYLAVITFICGLVGLRNSNYFYPALIVMLLGVLSAGTPVSYDLGVERVGFVLSGLLIAWVIRVGVWPDTLKRTFKTLSIECLTALNTLQEKIFLMYLKRDYQDNHFRYEKQLHRYHFAVLDSINRMRQLSAKNSLFAKGQYQKVIKRLDDLAERVDALGNLRYRINDLATLEVCENELRGVAQVLSEVFERVIHAKKMYIDQGQMDALEHIFQTTLQVISNEPVVVLIFINNVKKIFLELDIIANETRGI